MKPYVGPVVLLLSLTAGLSAVILYVLLKKDDDDNLEPAASAVYTARQTVIKIKIPKEMVGVLIGRQGATIKRIQQESGARACFDRCETSDDNVRECTIYGTADQAQKAETLIHEFLQNQPKCESFEMFVHRRHIGRIIGRNGSNVIHIKNTSHAKIDIIDEADSDQSKITIKGTNDQIAIARDLIENIIKEHSSSLEELQGSIQNRSPRVRPIFPVNGVPQLPPNSDDSHSEMLRPPGGRESLEVFVSALVNPGRFWVHVISKNGTKLDKLLDDMTNYYNNPENQELHKLSELNEKQIVAAVFPDDEKWYRAEIVTVTEESEKERQVEVFYVDYGDSRVVRENEVLELRTDFLTLRFQAIECFLAGIKPKNEDWSDEAVNMFEALTHVAQWKKLMVVIKTYQYEDNNKSPGQQSKRSIPGIELFDTQEGSLINIGEELVKASFAEKADDFDSFETEDFNAGPTTSQNQYRAVPELSDSGSDIDGFYVE